LLVFSGNEVKQLFEEIATRSDFAFEALEVAQDHLHGLVKSEPRVSPLAIVGRLKQESTIRLWQKHENELKSAFWKERPFWSDGYFCCTIGNASQETIRQYIESQGESAAFIHEAEDLVVFSQGLYKSRVISCLVCYNGSDFTGPACSGALFIHMPATCSLT
jgi:putative transposase